MSAETPDTRDLHRRAVRGGFWVMADRYFNKVLELIRLAVLGRLLSVSDFGLYGIGILALDILLLFSESGVQKALIQKKSSENIREYMDVAWTAGLVRGIGLFLIVFLAAPLFISFFDSSGHFEPHDIRNPEEIAASLRRSEDPFSEYLYANLDEETQQLVQTYPEPSGSEELLKEQLADQWNTLINRQRLQDLAFFQEAAASGYLHDLAQEPIDPKRQVRVNRLLMQEAMGDQINHSALDRSKAVLMVRLMGLGLLIGAFANPRMLLFQRDLQFHLKFLSNSLALFFSFVITIVFAVIYPSVWALVAGRLGGAILGLIINYTIFPLRPRLSFCRSKFRELWNYGKYLWGYSVTNFLVSEGDDIFVGRLLGVTALGYYRYAYKFGNMIATEFGDVVSRVTFPTYSKLQDNLEVLRMGYEKSLLFVVLMSYPMMGGAFVLAGDLVSVVLGDKWMEIVPAMQILLLVGLMRCNQGGVVFLSLGRTDLPLKLTFVRLTLIGILIYPLTRHFGIAGTAMTIAVSTAVQLPIMLWYVRRLIHHSFTDYLRVVSLPASGTLFMVFAVAGARFLLVEKAGWEIHAGTLLVLIGAGAASYSLYLLSAGRVFWKFNLVAFYRKIGRDFSLF